MSVVGRKRRASESTADSSEEVSAAKRRRTISEGEKPLFSKLHRHIGPAAEPSADSSDVKTDVSESTKAAGKLVTDGEQVIGRKDRKRKRTSVQSASEQDSDVPAKTTKASKSGDSSREVIHQGADEAGKAAKLSLQCRTENANQSDKKQKRVGKLKKGKKSKNKLKPEQPRLRVISKSRWLELRSEYLSIQKANIAQLKSSLNALKHTNTGQTTGVNGSVSTTSNVPSKTDEPKQSEISSLVFTPDVIVHIHSNSPLSRNDLRAQLSPLGSIAYIDVQDGDHSGHIRCSDAASAAKIVLAQVPGSSLQLLTGEPELCYWQKAAADRQKKHNTKNSRTSRRGRDKIMKKVEKVDASERKHVVFDD